MRTEGKHVVYPSVGEGEQRHSHTWRDVALAKSRIFKRDSSRLRIGVLNGDWPLRSLFHAITSCSRSQSNGEREREREEMETHRVRWRENEIRVLNLNYPLLNFCDQLCSCAE